MQARQGDFPSDGRKKHGKTIQKMGPVTGSKWGLQYFTPVDPIDFRLFIRVYFGLRLYDRRNAQLYRYLPPTQDAIVTIGVIALLSSKLQKQQSFATLGGE